ncbi:jg12468 [Pararge aegeria aegeria]|uniref:Jg12468 protein n=1 Tax=Pararge aegeria aegeria TaxID=348720 RepID=A0A8S4RQ17_9NEOP|nr:jg12468 [Pararge aegeria aegeria]
MQTSRISFILYGSNSAAGLDGTSDELFSMEAGTQNSAPALEYIPAVSSTPAALIATAMLWDKASQNRHRWLVY